MRTVSSVEKSLMYKENNNVPRTVPCAAISIADVRYIVMKIIVAFNDVMLHAIS